jgi:Fur family transcriptional regulator, ferric uptake regulator
LIHLPPPTAIHGVASARITGTADRDGVDAAVTALRRSGLRASASRRMIIKILRETVAPLSAQEISKGPDGGNIGLDLASVYRNLEILEDHGLVHQIQIGKGPGRYVLASGVEHEYLVCDRCGAIAGVDPDEMDAVRAMVRERYGYEVTFRRVPMVGVCRACLGQG